MSVHCVSDVRPCVWQPSAFSLAYTGSKGGTLSGDLRRSAHGPDIPRRKSQLLGRLLVAGPDLDLGRVHQSSPVERGSEAFRHAPHRRPMCHGEVVTPLAAWSQLALDYLLQDQGVKFRQVFHVGGRLTLGLGDSEVSMA